MSVTKEELLKRMKECGVYLTETGGNLYIGGGGEDASYLHFGFNDEYATIDGWFPAEHLEVIALVWKNRHLFTLEDCFF